jgi:hypothetical protein
LRGFGSLKWKEFEGVTIGGGYSGGTDGTVADRGREEIGTLVDCGVELINGRVAESG